jgi:single-strand DNA-binding protein
MSNDLNKCSFIGRLGADPETRYAPSGDAICSFSIAVGSQWKDKASGDKKEATEWVNVTAFGKLGEICSQYLRKGSQIYLEGRMKTEKYQAKDGTDRYSTKIIADNMQMLGGKQDGQASNSSPAPAATSKPVTGWDGLDSDIPF